MRDPAKERAQQKTVEAPHQQHRLSRVKITFRPVQREQAGATERDQSAAGSVVWQRCHAVAAAAEHRGDITERRANVARAKEHEQDKPNAEGQDPLRRAEADQEAVAHMPQRHGQRPAHAPDDECPVCTVPEPGQRHGDDERGGQPRPRRFEKRKRRKEVIADPKAERDVPAAPEVLRGQRRERWRKFTASRSPNR